MLVTVMVVMVTISQLTTQAAKSREAKSRVVLLGGRTIHSVVREAEARQFRFRPPRGEITAPRLPPSHQVLLYPCMTLNMVTISTPAADPRHAPPRVPAAPRPAP